jgi:hypothetical protein
MNITAWRAGRFLSTWKQKESEKRNENCRQVTSTWYLHETIGAPSQCSRGKFPLFFWIIWQSSILSFNFAMRSFHSFCQLLASFFNNNNAVNLFPPLDCYS